MDKQELIDFENDIEEIYKSGAIRGVIHLRDGGEDDLIEIFKSIKSDDYVFSTWANHRHALLKGIPKELVKQRILDGKSMEMSFQDYKFYCSAIVGGIGPIATGVALGIKKKGGSNHVYVMIGDMGFQAGVTHESIRFSIYNNLPITFVIEDNNKSVDTPTDKSWGSKADSTYLDNLIKYYNKESSELNGRKIIKYYKYQSRFPHSGCGVFVSF